MRVLLAISLLALAGVLWASLAAAQHIRRARRRKRGAHADGSTGEMPVNSNQSTGDVLQTHTISRAASQPVEPGPSNLSQEPPGQASSIPTAPTSAAPESESEVNSDLSKRLDLSPSIPPPPRGTVASKAKLRTAIR